MAQYDAGTASIKVKPSFRDFVTETETQLQRYNFNLDIQIGADTRVAAAEIENLQRIARENQTFRVDADTGVAATEIAGLRAAAREPLVIRTEIDRDSTSRVRSQATRTAREIRQDLGKALDGLRDAATINLRVLGVVGAAGAIAELLAIAQAASKVANTVALIPAIGFAGLAGAGSVATGLSGISAAFKAQAAASKEAGDSAREHRDRLDAVADGEYRAQQADRTHLDSLRDLNTAYRDASRSIRDMNFDLDDQRLATEDAAIGVDEAAKRLAQVQFDPTADSITRRRAQLGYEQAVQRLREQQVRTQDLAQDTAEANARGVEGSRQVVDAKQKASDATHAQTVAERELAKVREDAGKGSAAQSKADEAMAKLSPNARQLVQDVRALGPAWSEARKESQDALTNGMGAAVTHLAGQQLPNLRAGMVGINGAINTGIRSSLAALASETNKVDFRTSLDNTTRAFQNAARGSDAWTNALTKLVTVGSEFLPRFGDAISHAGDRFDALIQRTAADGSLKKWIQDGIDTGKELASIVGNIGSSILSVFRAAGDDGATLRKLDDLTERMSKFLKSTEGQKELRDFFTMARESFERMLPVLGDLPPILRGVFEGFQTWSGIAMPFLRAAADLLAAHPGLVRDVVVAYLAFKTIGPIFDVVRAGINNANDAVRNFRSGLSGATGPNGAGGAIAGLGGLLGVAGPLGAAALAIGAGAGLTYLINKHQEAARAADEQREHELALQNTLDKTTGKVTRQTLEQAASELQQQGFLTRAESFGINPQRFLLASTGQADADKAAINQQLTQSIVESLGRDKAYTGITRDWFQSAGLNDRDIAAALQGVPEAVQKYADAVKKYNDALGSSNRDKALPDLANLKNELDDVGESAATLGGKMNGYSTEVGSAGERQRQLNRALEGSFQLTADARQRFEGMGLAIQQIPDGKTVVIKDTTPENLQRLRELKYEIHNNLDGTLTIVADTERAKADISQVTNAPYTAKVDVKFAFDEAQLNVEARRALNPGSGDYTTVTGGHVGGRAKGGQLPTTGPGTERRDGFLGVAASSGVPISWLDGGEWIINRDSSKTYGRELAAINAGTFPKLPGHEDGGIIGAAGKSPAQLLDEYARSRSGAPYGGADDCSGFISQLANIATGLPSNAGRMSTANEGEWLAAHGFQNGIGGAGSFRVGWVNDPSMPAGGHTAGTLPSGVNVESGGATGTVMYGGAAIGANNSLFNQHANLPMGAGPNTSGVGGIGTGDTSGVTSSTVTYPQAPLPGRMSDQQIQQLQAESAIDAANSERNAVYANPNSTDRDKQAADLKYQQAQNARESLLQRGGGDTSALSLPGIASKAAGILAQGFLAFFGLENSIFSDSNPYNRALNTTVNFYSQKAGTLGGGYSYQPKNLPSVVTTTTPQSSVPVDDPAYRSAVPGSLNVNTDLGTTTLTLRAPTPTYQTGAGAEQWRGLATQMLAREGFNPAQVDIMLAQIQLESGGNPSIIQQVQDVNSGGNEAVGLLQVIPGTFAQYRDPSLPNDRTNPAANMAAALRYYRARYGTDLRTMWGQGHGYADGGWVEGIGGSRGDGIHARVSPGEFIVNAYDAARNAPLLEAINSSAWSSTRITSDGFPGAGAATGTGSGHNFSTTIVEPRVADVGDLVDLAERSAQKKAIGLAAALI
ncbi:transglycosylase SLT domain-containing protein [Nocardia sp. NPDC051911]|uniref:transglycosylase SLT domain-containing protein n=1 Tax=Nocardia sp. NPDC051911 TaxID=3154648 RepID=UPI00342EEAD6